MLDTLIESTDLVKARVHGEIFALPDDLYIPPDALQIFLETFEGPFDLLLYLIKKNNIDILNIPIAQITQQYLSYVDLMQGLRFELAAEYLVMAAMLAEIKSRMLLPRQESTEVEEDDPRMELVRRLQEYEQFKKAAEELNSLPQEGRNVFTVQLIRPLLTAPPEMQPIPLAELLNAFKAVMQRASMFAHHAITRENLTVRERMSDILTLIQNAPSPLTFGSCFRLEEGRQGVVVTFLAILELLKQALIDVIQNELFDEISLKSVN